MDQCDCRKSDTRFAAKTWIYKASSCFFPYGTTIKIIILSIILVPPLYADLLVHYKMDDTAGTVVMDSSGSNHHGAIVPRTTANGKSWPQWSKLGKINGAIHFFGNGSVNVPADAFPAAMNRVTIAFWTYGADELAQKSGTPPVPDKIAAVVDSEDSIQKRLIRVDMPESGAVKFTATSSGSFQNISKAVTDEELEGSWHHWAFVKDSVTGDMKIYLDGAEWLSKTGKTKVPASISKFVIGGRTADNYYYSGLIDDFRIYDTMLSASAIQQLATLHTVTFQAAANGRIQGESTQIVINGDNTTTVTAAPHAGFVFKGWTGDYTGTENPLTITNVNQNSTITANFVVNAQPDAPKTVSGILDEVYVFNHALSSEDVTHLYFQGTPYNHYSDTAQLYRNQSTYDLNQETYQAELIWSAPAHAELNFRSYHYYPQAVTCKDYTYVVYADPDRYPMVAKINNADPSQVTVKNLDTNYGQMLDDGHHTIAIGVDKDGYIHVSGDMHNYSIYDSESHMPASYQDGHCNYWRSDSPEDITAFTWYGDQVKKAPQGRGFTYMGFFNDMFGELYYYSRLAAGGNYRVYSMSRYDTSTGEWTTLGGTTLDDPYLKMIYEDNDEKSSGYSKIQSTGIFDRKNRLHIAANILNSETGPDFDPNFDLSHYSTDIVYMRSDNGLNGWVKGDGSPSPMPARVEAGPDQGDVVVTWTPANFAFATHSSVAFDRHNNPIVLADTKTNGGGGHLVMSWDETSGWVNKGDMGRTGETLQQAFTDPAGVITMIVNNDNKLVRFWDPGGPIRDVEFPSDYGELKGYDREYVKLTGNIQGIIQTTDGKIGLLRIKINRPALTPPALPAAKAIWSLDETAVDQPVADSSGNGFVGVRLGDPDSSRIVNQGQSGRALGFDGIDDAVLVSALDWTPTAFSVGFWVKPTNNADYSQIVRAVNGWDAFNFQTSASGEVYVGTDAANRLGPDELPPGTVVADEWQHFVFTFDNGTGRLFRNSLLIAEKSGMQVPQAWGGMLMGYAETSPDLCPADPAKTDPGLCGCGVEDTDTDLDGTPDCNDNCPNDAGKTGPGACGCGAADTDSNNDGIPDCNDDLFNPAGTVGTGPVFPDSSIIDTDTINTGSIQNPIIQAGVDLDNQGGTIIGGTNSGTIVGGTLEGELDNSCGSLEGDITLACGSKVDGGTITGTLTGQQNDSPIITNAVINTDTISDVVIGNGCIITEGTAKKNPGMNLMDTISYGDTIMTDVPLILEDNGATKSVNDNITDTVNSVLGVIDTQAQGEENGCITIASDDGMGDTLIPAAVVSIITTDQPDSVSLTSTGEILVVGNGLAMTLAPMPVDQQGFQDALLDVGASGDIGDDGVVIAVLPGGEKLAIRFDNVAQNGGTFQFNSQTASFSLTGDTAQPETLMILVTYPDGTVQKMPPFIHHLAMFKQVMESTPGITYNIAPSTGIITIFNDADGQTLWRGIPGYALLDPPDFIIGLKFESAGDVNGDGLDDFYVVTCLGKQVVYTLE